MEQRETDLWFCFISEEASEQPWGYTAGNRINNSTQVRSHIRTPALQVGRHHCSQHCQPWCWTMDSAAIPVVSAAPDTWTTHCHLHRVCHSIQPSSSLCVTMSWLRVQHVVTCLVEPSGSFQLQECLEARISVLWRKVVSVYYQDCQVWWWWFSLLSHVRLL